MTDVEPTMAPEREVAHRRELYKFSPEELRVLKECNYESFYYRSLPFGTALGALAMYGVKSGFVKGSLKWGPWPKVALGATLGYFIGKISYQKKCAEKLMTLPNSPLAEVLRQRKAKSKGGFQESFASEPINMIPQSYSESENGNQTDIFQELRADDRSYEAPPTAAGLNDSYRPTVDSFSVSEQPLPPLVQNTTSYDDLRRRNREEYEQKRSEAYKRASPSPAPPAYSGYKGVPSSPGSRNPNNKNAYGDVWEE